MNDGKWMTRSSLLAMAGRMADYTGEINSSDQALLSVVVISPENVTFNTKYNLSVAIPDFRKHI